MTLYLCVVRNLVFLVNHGRIGSAVTRPDMPGFRVVELAADTAVAHEDWAGAAAVLQEFVTRVPNHIPALMRLVEICVDGGLEATMYSAQAQLADAYIAAGAATEARFIAEDLVAREPWEKSNIERFRRALVLLGEPDPDGLIASRLSGDVPFTSTDLTLGSVVSGDIVGGDGERGRVRGQVIALGVQSSLGRPFDAAVIELFGDVPQGDHSTRLDGVMVVDRVSGVLLRLELRSGNPEFALRRTLVRIEPAPAHSRR